MYQFLFSQKATANERKDFRETLDILEKHDEEFADHLREVQQKFGTSNLKQSIRKL